MHANGAANGATYNRFLKTLNVSDSPWACDGYNAGTIGHNARTFEIACELAAAHGFDATNLHVDFLLEHGPQAVVALLEKHGLQPGAARFPIKLTDEADDAAFDASLNKFEIEAPLLAEAGYTVLAYHLLPWSQATPSLPFHEHFRRTAARLARVVPILERHGLTVALEPIGAFGLRRVREHAFVHTIEGVRALIAAASAERCVGIKFDTFHWHVCGGLLGELAKLDASEIVYVELNDLTPARGRWTDLEVPELHRELPGDSAARCSVAEPSFCPAPQFDFAVSGVFAALASRASRLGSAARLRAGGASAHSNAAQARHFQNLRPGFLSVFDVNKSQTPVLHSGHGLLLPPPPPPPPPPPFGQPRRADGQSRAKCPNPLQLKHLAPRCIPRSEPSAIATGRVRGRREETAPPRASRELSSAARDGGKLRRTGRADRRGGR